MEEVRSADGTPIAFERLGSADGPSSAGPTILVVHGGFVDRRRSLPVAAELARRFAVAVMDRRGRGGSGPYGPDHTIEREFEDVVAVVRVLRPPVAVVGHSCGAWCALEAARLGERVERLVLYEPPPLWAARDAAVDRIRELLAEGRVDEAVAFLLSGPIGLPAAQVEAIRGSSFWQIVADCAPVFLPEIEAGRRFRFEPSMFSDLAVPTLLVTGTLSQPALRPVTEAVAAALPDARIHELPGQGHGAMNAAPAEFASIVADFVAP